MFIEEFCIARFRWDVYLAINYELLFHITYVKIVSDVHCRLRAFEYQYHSVFIGEFRILCCRMWIFVFRFSFSKIMTPDRDFIC